MDRTMKGTMMQRMAMLHVRLQLLLPGVSPGFPEESRMEADVAPIVGVGEEDERFIDAISDVPIAVGLGMSKTGGLREGEEREKGRDN